MADALMNTSLPDLKSKQVLTEARRGLKVSWSEVKWLLRVFVSSGDRFYWDNGFSRAASLAYSSLLSLIPITALCFGILATFVQTADHMTQVREFFFKQFVPGTSTFNQLLPLLEQFSDKIIQLNYVVITTLIVTSILLLNSIEYTLNQVWQVYEVRPITDRLAIFCAIIVLIPFFAISGYYTSAKVEPLFAGFDLLTAAPGSSGLIVGQPGDPRTFGITIRLAVKSR